MVAKDPKPKQKLPSPPLDQIEELEEDLDQSTPSSSGNRSESKLKPEFDPNLDLVPTKRKAPSTRSERRL